MLSRILLVSDTAPTDCNGAAETLRSTTAVLSARGFHVSVIEPSLYPGGPIPLFPSVPCALVSKDAIETQIRSFEPDAVHIFTEGSLGRMAKKGCEKLGLRFTTSYLTSWSFYLEGRGYSSEAIWVALRNFHNS